MTLLGLRVLGRRLQTHPTLVRRQRARLGTPFGEIEERPVVPNASLQLSKPPSTERLAPPGRMANAENEPDAASLRLACLALLLQCLIFALHRSLRDAGSAAILRSHIRLHAARAGLR